MNLKHVKKQLIVVDYGDLDEFISDIYGREYEIVADLELMQEGIFNDVSKSTLVKKEQLDKWQQGELNKWKTSGRGNRMFHTLMTDLCNRDLIEPGEYLIEISW